jgi:hypothetical protein
MEPAFGQGIGVLVLLAFVFIAKRILGPVTDEPRDWEAMKRTVG